MYLTRRRWVAVECLLFSLLLTLMACGAEEEPSKFRFLPSDSAGAADDGASRTAARSEAGDGGDRRAVEPGVESEDEDPEHGAEMSRRSRAEEEDEPSAITMAPPHQGRTLTVGKVREIGEGVSNLPSFDPSELDQALRSARPGDRIILGPARYEGPIVLDDRVRNGVQEKPIQLIALKDAVFTLAKNDSADFVLEVDRSFWSFYGIEITSPQASTGGIRVSNAKAVEFHGLHIHEVGGDGIVLEDSVRRLRVENSHLHQIGLGRFGGPAVAIDVASAGTQVDVMKTRIHHVSSTPIRVAGTAWLDLLADQPLEDETSLGNLRVVRSVIK